jgi:hypothetical protein
MKVAGLMRFSIDGTTFREESPVVLSIPTPLAMSPMARPLTSSATGRLAHRVAYRFALSKTATIVMRDTPAPGWVWGWFWDVEPRMIIEPMDIEHRRLGWIFLEDREGQRTFQAVGAIPARVLAKLRPVVEANRYRIEAAWVRTMIISGWVDARLVQCMDGIQIVAYRGLPNQRLNLVTVNWPRIIGSRAPEPEDVALDRDAGALLIGAREPIPVRVPLASILWREAPTTREADLLRNRSGGGDAHDLLHRVCRRLPSDFKPYGDRFRGGEPDCSCGCRFYVRLPGDLEADWGVCANPRSPRAGLVTFEHQGCAAFESGATAD